MRFHAVGKRGGAPQGGAPFVMLLSPELSGWWAMASLSARLGDEGYNTVVATWDGFGEGAGTAFPGVQQEAQEVCAWVSEHLGAPLLGLVGCGLGGQVAVEALCEDAQTARCLMVGDVLCQKVPGAGASAALTAWAFRRMGAPAVPVLDAAKGQEHAEQLLEQRLPRVERRRRYLASQMDGLGLPRALAPQFARAVAVTPGKAVRATVEAVDAWRIPDDVRAIRCPVLVTSGALDAEPYRASAEALHQALPQSRLSVARDLGRNELYLRYPERAVELLAPLLSAAR